MVSLKPQEGDFVLHDFCFHDGTSLPALNLHYTTLGTPQRGTSGHVNNAVLIMHGTGGSGTGFLSAQFAGVLFGPGAPLDADKHFIVLPDAIGHGRSSKPSDGLRARFPAYTYDDIVGAQHKLLTEWLGVDHLRLVMGTSMGGMQTWVWGARFPSFMDALLPLASLPVEIAGLNRMRRKMLMDSITADPAWAGGEYTAQPRAGLIASIHIVLGMTSAPRLLQQQAPTRAQADALLEERVHAQLATAEANDWLYQFDSSRDYNPAPDLHKIVAPLVAINSADDLVNPPDLGVMEAHICSVKRGRYVLIPTSDDTRGHGTHSVASLWKDELVQLLAESQQS